MKRLSAFLGCLFLMFVLACPGFAAEIEEPQEIYTVEDLLKIGEDPSGSYLLMNDLDMSGVEWPSQDFSGTFDGNGHAILNLTLSQPGPTKLESYDGNLKAYETGYVGLFATMQSAEVKNLKLLNVRGVVESDEPIFLAGVAGYFHESTVSNCTVTGTLELRAHDRMFGIGGVAGFGGIGLIENCDVDVTLICTDTDAQTKDEQFLGGVYATGFVDVKDCTVTIDGYASEHGYAHNGGIVGMFMQAPFGWKIQGKIIGNNISGKITFFEDNPDRRAYCHPIIGETLAVSISNKDNKYDFKNDERKEYDVELRPEMCAEPQYSTAVTPSGCDTYGYTTYTCDGCGYSYTDQYTLFAHTVSDWKETVPATLESEGLLEGNCDFCGIAQQKASSMLEPEPTIETEVYTQPAPTESEQPESDDRHFPVLPIAAGVLLLTVVLILLLKPRKKGKFQK